MYIKPYKIDVKSLLLKQYWFSEFLLEVKSMLLRLYIFTASIKGYKTYIETFKLFV